MLNVPVQSIVQKSVYGFLHDATKQWLRTPALILSERRCSNRNISNHASDLGDHLMFINKRQVTIEWGDCDPAGIVFYPRYFEIFDASTAYLFQAALGYSKYEMTLRFGIVGYPMVETGAYFHVPSRYGDVVSIETQITRFGRSSFDVSHRLFRGDVLSIEANETRVWSARDPENSEKIKGVPIPQAVIDALSLSI
jgi:4-hydroxybenzoyl-CoA thioesterase